MKNTRIDVSLGRTLNMGNYESLRVDLGFSFDCSKETTTKELEEKIEEAYDFVRSQLEKEIKISAKQKI